MLHTNSHEAKLTVLWLTLILVSEHTRTRTFSRDCTRSHATCRPARMANVSYCALCARRVLDCRCRTSVSLNDRLSRSMAGGTSMPFPSTGNSQTRRCATIGCSHFCELGMRYCSTCRLAGREATSGERSSKRGRYGEKCKNLFCTHDARDIWEGFCSLDCKRTGLAGGREGGGGPVCLAENCERPRSAYFNPYCSSGCMERRRGVKCAREVCSSRVSSIDLYAPYCSSTCQILARTYGSSSGAATSNPFSPLSSGTTSSSFGSEKGVGKGIVRSE